MPPGGDLPPDLAELAARLSAGRPVASTPALERVMSRAHGASGFRKRGALWRPTPPRPRKTVVALGVVGGILAWGGLEGGAANALEITSVVRPPVNVDVTPRPANPASAVSPSAVAPAVATTVTPAPVTPAPVTPPSDTSPGRRAAPAATSPQTGMPKADADSRAQVAEVQAGEHPFTGLSLELLGLTGLLLAATGGALRRLRS